MKNSLKSVDALLAGAKHPSTEQADTTTLLHRRLLHTDSDVAKQVAQDHAISKATTDQKAEIVKLETEISYFKEMMQEAKLRVKNVRKNLSALPEKVKRNPGQEEYTVFIRWRRSDQIAIISLLAAMLCLLFTASFNVYVSLMASGEAAFLDAPIIAVMISMLLPCASLAIKFFVNVFHSPRTKKLYCIGLYALTGIAVFAWVIVFASQFGGVSEGVSWDDLGSTDSGGKSNLLNTLQLIAEMLCASSIGMAAEELFQKYHPDTWIDNEEFLRFSKQVNKEESLYQSAHKEYVERVQKLEWLRAEHAKSVIEQIAAFTSLNSGFGVVRSTSSLVELVKYGVIIILAILLGVSVASNASAKTLVVGMSPFVEEGKYEAQSKSLLRALTEQMELGDEAVLLDAYQLQVIGRFSIPDKPAYRSEKARLKVNAKTVRALFNWPNTLSEDLQRPDIEGAIKFPQFMRYVALNHRYAMNGEGADILILGSPFYDIANSDPFRMTTEGILPSDGHLNASRSLSVYGTADSKNMLQGWRVHQGYGENMHFGSDRISFAVERWWTLFVEAMNGKLSTFTPDLDSAIRRALDGAEPFPHQYVPEDTDRLQMLHLYIDDQRNHIPVQERPLTVTPLSQSSIDHAKDVTIGLSWNCACDLDLYARPFPEAGILSFTNRKTSQGEYYQDVRGRLSGNHHASQSGMETIVFSAPVELKKLQIAVVYFAGSAVENINGEIRLGIGDKTYAHPFQIHSSRGGSNRMVNESFTQDRAMASHLVMINPLEIIQTVSQ